MIDKVAKSPCMVEGDDVRISVLVLVVRLLTLLGRELVQARGSSEVKNGLRLFGLRSTFSFGWFLGGWELCATVRGEGTVVREEVSSSQQLVESHVFG